MLSFLLTTVIIVSGLVNLSLVSAADTYTFSTTDVRSIIISILKGEKPSTPMNGKEDRDGDGSINTIDVRTMLKEILQGNNTITLSQPIAANAIRLSSISDVASSTKTRSYEVYAPYTDTYTITSTYVSSIQIYSGDNLIGSGTSSLNVSLQAGVGYTLTVTARYANYSYSLTVVADNHKVTLPYDVAKPMDTSGISTDNNKAYVVESCNIHYQKREGGTYVYCNNPELIQSDAIGDALMRNDNLTGDVFVTYEHSSYTSSSFYLGYQVKNNGTSDVYITVTNVGYQTTGSWFGQYAWYDFYNTSFTLPSSSSYNNDNYLFYDYTPRVFQPITYRLPAGKYFYVVGGTSSDAYNNINVDGSANRRLSKGNCANAAVKFTVTGGSVTGTMYCYSSTSQVKAEPAQTGYRVDNNSKGASYGLQYQGSADHHGVIDSYIDWTFNDEIGSGMLPVTYTNYYDPNYASITTPYAAYNSTAHTHERKFEWVTHINPQDVNTAVGTDMVAFSCVDANGVKRVLDTDHVDGTGSFGNFGNWMIEYQEHFTLVNQGSKERVITLHYGDNGALALMARDSNTGEVLQADFPVGGDTIGINYTYQITIPAHSIKQITISYVLMPMSAGTVSHMASIA
ncbi:MAG: hypothetical protein E7553_01320 [Ruminococcaceae bacterium]|nr:hypothetical protein [Oscillospiraceae bacterium]